MANDDLSRDYAGRWFLVAAVLLAAAVNIACWRSVEPVLTDSTEYIFGGVSLFSGHGYSSIYGGPHYKYPPGLPLLIGLVNLVVREPVVSARLIVMLSSVLALIPLALIAGRLFGRSAGIAAAAVYAVIPMRVQLSSVVLTEPFYLCLVLLGVWLWIREADNWKWTRAAVLGAVFGYAYLVRPEGLLCAAVLFAFSFLPRRFGPVPPVRSVLISALVIAVVAAPWVVYVHGVTGKWTLTSKSGKGEGFGCLLIQSRGLPWSELYRLNEDCTRINFEPIQETRAEFLRKLFRNALVEKGEIAGQIGRFLTAVLMLGLALEIYRSNARLWSALPVLLVLGLPLFALPALYPEPRYVFTGLMGVLILACWQLVTRFRAPWANQQHSRPAAAAAWIPLFIVCVYMLAGSRHMILADNTPTQYSAIGSWLRGRVSSDEVVLTVMPQIAFYAGRRPARLPYDEMAKVMRYARFKNADYILLLPEDKHWYDQAGELKKGLRQGLLAQAGALELKGIPAAWLYRIRR